MKKIAAAACFSLILAVLPGPCVTAGAQEHPKASQEAIYRSLKEAKASLSSEVRDLTVVRDAAGFVLESGWIDVFEPVEGRYHAAVFRGQGVFKFDPPTPIERDQLEKFTGKQSLEEPFESIVFRFTDATIDEIRTSRRLEPTISGMGGEGEALLEKDRKKSLEQFFHNLDARILLDVVSGKDGYFIAQIDTKTMGRLVYEIDPQAREEVTLYTYEKSRGYADLWCSFHLKDQYENNKPVRDVREDIIEVPHFDADLTLDKKGKLSGIVTLEIVALDDSVRAIPFDISQVIDVETIEDEAGNPCFFVHEVARDRIGQLPLKQQTLDVCLPAAIKKGEHAKLTFHYSSEKMIQRIPDTKMYNIASTTSWYPVYGYLLRSTSRCTYRCPPDLDVIAVGRKDKEWEEDGLKCSTWYQEIPVAFICFNMGDFEHKQIKVDDLPPANVYMGKEHYGLRIGGDANQNVAADVLNSLSFLQQLLGPYPFSQIVASEIPGGHGQGFPGFLHLAYGTFQDEWPQGIDEAFRAHEVSHQWWGHVVGWDTYHDQWLSEGFAEYSGALFAHMTLKDKKKDLLLKMVDNWKNDILHKGNMSFERFGMGKIPGRYTMGSDSGPLWLGYRLNSSKTPIDYQILVYEKGAYVLHMLRMMMKDFNDNSDDKFLAMMKDFVKQYTWKNGTTQGFQRVAEKHMNMKLQWFFDQWVYGTAIPKYKFRHRIEPGPGGKDLLVCDVEQSGVPDGFKMPVPLMLDFGKNRSSIVRLPITKASETFRMAVPSRPKNVEFNFYKSVLCYED